MPKRFDQTSKAVRERMGWRKRTRLFVHPFEILEHRNLLAAAPVAVNDSYVANEDTILIADGGSTPWTVALRQTQPQHWWRFEETSGSVARDDGSSRVDGTIGGGVTLDQTGAVGRAASFDGTGFVRIGKGLLAGDWTVETIVRIKIDESANHTLLGGEVSQILANGITLAIGQFDHTGSLGVTQYAVANWRYDVPSPTQLTHVAFVSTAGAIDLYVSGSWAGRLEPSFPLWQYVIGAGHLGDSDSQPSDPMVGLIDELAIYHRSLTAEEIAAHYQAMQDTARGFTADANRVLHNDTDADRDVLTATLVSPSQHGRLEFNAAGGLTYWPNPDFHGTDQFTYTAFDGALRSDPATVTITVLPVNDRPIAVDDGAYVATKDTVLSVPANTGPLANDRDADGDALTATLDTPPANGSVEFHPDGSFVYTPRPGSVRRDTFTYRVSDGTANSEIARVVIRVVHGGANSGLAVDDFYSVAEDQTLEVGATPWLSLLKVPLPVRSLAYDPRDDRLFATIPKGAGPLGGTLTEIDPYTGQLGQSISLPGELGHVVISDDGETMHVAVEGGRAIQMIDLNTMTLGPIFRFPGRIVVRDMLAIPGRSQAVVISTWDPNVSQPWIAGIWENGELLPDKGGGPLMAVDETGTRVFGYENWLTSFYFWEHEVDARGMHVVKEHPWGSMLSGFIDSIQYAQGHLFVSGFLGGIVRLASRKNMATFEGGWIYQAVSHENTLYSFDDATQFLHAYDLATFQKRDSVKIPNFGPVRHVLTRFGNDGLAIYNETELALIRTDEIFGVERRGVLRNDLLSAGDAPGVQLVDDVDHGTLSLRSDGTFTYQPVANYQGLDSFRYSFADASGTSHSATVSLSVTPVNDLPIANNDRYIIPDEGSLLVDAAAGVLSNDADPFDGDPLKAELVTPPRFGTLRLQPDGSFTYRPGARFVLSDEFTYQASDGTDRSEIRTVILRANVPAIEVGQHVLKANTPNQRIDIFVSGGQMVSGVDFYAQVGDGGPEKSTLGLPAGTDGPSIAHVELKQNTIFAAVSDAATNLGSLPQLANWSLSVTEQDGVVADGLLASLIVDTTGFFEGEWDLSLVGALPDHPLGPLDTRFANTLAFVTNGSISIVPAKVVRRQIFYNNSIWDGNDATAGPADDQAIAMDKRPLLPGQTASFANYTSYSRGLNGVMLNIEGLPDDVELTASDFDLRMGRQANPSTWLPAPEPTVTIRRGAGVDGSDRVTLIWPDNAIQNNWLSVIAASGARTLLGHDDVFYVGNAIGETGSVPGNTFVTSIDVIGARDHHRGPFDLAPIDDVYDFNRDRLVTSIDVIIARDHQSGALTSLPLIVAPSAPAAAVAADWPRNVDAVWLAGDDPCHSSSERRITLGDVNLDGRFDSSDLVAVFQRGKYGVRPAERQITWMDGDWDSDGDFDADDLAAAFQASASRNPTSADRAKTPADKPARVADVCSS